MAIYPITLYQGNYDGVDVIIKYYIADTITELPSSGLNVGDLGRAIDTGRLYYATSTTEFAEVARGFGSSNVLIGVGSSNIYLGSLATASRMVSFLDANGSPVIVGRGADPPAAAYMGLVNKTSQSAAVAATNLTNATSAGYYRVSYTIEDTTADVTAGTIQFQISYTDDIGATTQVGAELPLTAVGRDRGSFQVYLASGNITYQTNLIGIIGTSRYALRVRCEFLG